MKKLVLIAALLVTGCAIEPPEYGWGWKQTAYGETRKVHPQLMCWEAKGMVDECDKYGDRWQNGKRVAGMGF